MASEGDNVSAGSLCRLRGLLDDSRTVLFVWSLLCKFHVAHPGHSALVRLISSAVYMFPSCRNLTVMLNNDNVLMALEYWEWLIKNCRISTGWSVTGDWNCCQLSCLRCVLTGSHAQTYGRPVILKIKIQWDLFTEAERRTWSVWKVSSGTELNKGASIHKQEDLWACQGRRERQATDYPPLWMPAWQVSSLPLVLPDDTVVAVNVTEGRTGVKYLI